MALQITGLTVDNYKRITLAELKFDPDRGGVVALMGANESGKSSTLDGLEALIAGRKAPKQAMPVHKGADTARVIASFREDDGTELVVTRTYQAGGSTSIEVRQDGLKVARPDDILSRLYSHVALDPLAFANLDTKAQTQTLLGLIGFDPSKLDEEAANVYATRTEVGREVKRLQGTLESFPPADPAIAATPLVDVAEVQRTLEEARQYNANKVAYDDKHQRATAAVLEIDQVIEDLETRLESARKQREIQVLDETMWRKRAEGITELPTQGYLDQIATADATNQAIRAQQNRAATAADLADAQGQVNNLTARLDQIAAEKAKGFASAKMPIPGLTVEDGEVWLDGTPFSQTSAGGKLRTSTAIAMALNPELRAIIIRDGSLLDSKNRGIIDELAKANDFTVLMEIVDESAPAGVVFEDGRIVEVRA